MMKKVILIFLISLFFFSSASSRYRLNPKNHSVSASIEKDSSLYILVKKISAVVEEKAQRETRFMARYVSSSTETKQQTASRNNQKKQRSTGLRDPITIYTDTPSVIINGVTHEISINALIGMNVNKLDSIRIIMDKSPGGYAVYGRRMEAGVIVLYPYVKSKPQKTRDIMVSKQPERLTQLAQSAKSRSDSTLFLFVKDIYTILGEEGAGKANSTKFNSRSRKVVINGKEIENVQELLQYSIFDIAYLTIKISPTVKSRRVRPKQEVIHLTTYKNVMSTQ